MEHSYLHSGCYISLDVTLASITVEIIKSPLEDQYKKNMNQSTKNRLFLQLKKALTNEMKTIFKGIIEELSPNKKHQHLYIKRTFLSQLKVKETRIMAREL